jgi:hypothetical protein
MDPEGNGLPVINRYGCCLVDLSNYEHLHHVGRTPAAIYEAYAAEEGQ